MIALKIVYVANIVVAGWISITALFFPKTAMHSVFQNAFQYSDSFRLVGALWFAIFLLSIVGLFYPVKMSPVLMLQFIYKGSWLIVAALPAILNKQEYPSGMAAFFLIWVLLLPFIIPWKDFFH